MTTYLPLFAAWAIAVISPGPDFLAVLRTSAAHGRRHGAIVGAGVTCGIACWALLALTGLSVLLARFAHAYLVLRAVGALFLMGYGVYILWGTWRSRGAVVDPHATDTATTTDNASPWSSWRLGLATNLANPKALIFFGALFATVLPPHLGVAAKASVLVGMLAIAICWFTTLAVVAGSGPVMRGYQRAARSIDTAAGALFTLVGLALLPH